MEMPLNVFPFEISEINSFIDHKNLYGAINKYFLLMFNESEAVEFRECHGKPLTRTIKLHTSSSTYFNLQASLTFMESPMRHKDPRSAAF